MLALSMILLTSYGATLPNECASDAHCPGSMRCLKNPDGRLVCREPGFDEGIKDVRCYYCPGGDCSHVVVTPNGAFIKPDFSRAFYSGVII